MRALEDKVAIITGAGRGIGRAEALRFAEEGCRVVVNDIGTSPTGEGRDPEVARAVVREIEAAGGQALASDHDVSSSRDADALVNAAIETFGKVDILVTNATILRDAAIVDVDDDAWEATMNANVRGTFTCLRAVVRHLVQRKAPGRILLTTSIAGLRGNPRMPAYSAAKGGIYALMCTAAQELHGTGITVNSMSPIAYTRLTEEPMKGIPDASIHLSPRFVADVAAYLVSDAAADVNGVVVDVQGSQVSTSRMLQGAGVLPREGARWSIDELHERWLEIAQLSRVQTIADAAALMKSDGG
jgi:NAD(P)-dependent dehydrogenase (short-subunit alcohol dehydrogenase family)